MVVIGHCFLLKAEPAHQMLGAATPLYLSHMLSLVPLMLQSFTFQAHNLAKHPQKAVRY